MSTTAATPVTSDWAGSPISTLHHAARQDQSIPVEQYPDGASYVVRFEVPGVDPVRDITVTVEAGTLLVQAERRYAGPDGGRSEFRYDRFARSITMPPGANPAAVSASYRGGILTVRIGMVPEHQHTARTVPVAAEA